MVAARCWPEFCGQRDGASDFSGSVASCDGGEAFLMAGRECGHAAASRSNRWLMNSTASARAASAEAEGTLDDTRPAANIAREVEGGGLPLAQRPHHLKALDRRIRCSQGLEAAHRPDQLLQLAVIGLDNVVQIFDLTVEGILGTFALRFQLANGRGIGRRLVRVDDMGFLPILQAIQRLAKKALRRLRAPGGREIEIDRFPVLVDRPIEIGPFAANLDVGLIDPPTRRAGPHHCHRSRFSISGTYR